MSLSEKVDLSVILPAYEEADNLQWLLPELKKILGDLYITFEIIVVDTEKPYDATAEICFINKVCHIPRRGGSSYGSAVRTGIANSRGNYILLMDADGSHSPSYIPFLWAERQQYDLVIASRYIAGGTTENPWILIVLSHLVNISFRLILSLPCHDISNSFRLYMGEWLRDISLVSDGFDIVEEMLVKMIVTFPDLRIKEIPTNFAKRQAGTTKRNLLIFALLYITTLYRLSIMRFSANHLLQKRLGTEK